MREKAITLLWIIGIIVIMLSAIWLFPRWQAKSIGEEGYWEVENELRKTWAQIFGGLTLFGGIYLAWKEHQKSKEQLNQTVRQMEQSSKEFQQSQETIKAGQISSRFNQAYTQLSHKEAINRIGAIYALEQIVIESPNYIQTVLDVLTNFVKNSDYFDHKEKKDKEAIVEEIEDKIKENLEKRDLDFLDILIDIKKFLSKIKTLPEVQVALTVIGRIKTEIESKLPSCRINLRDTILINANLQNANLQGANLHASSLQNAILMEANLQNANLISTNLIGASLKEANLQEAILFDAKLQGTNLENANIIEGKLIDAHLQGANLYKANLQEADLTGARLQNAYLFGANLLETYLYRATFTNVTGITVEMLLKAKSLYSVKGLDPEIAEELKKRKPELFEKPKEEEKE